MGYRMKNHDRFIWLVRMIERNSVSENGKSMPEKREVGRDDKNRRVRDKRYYRKFRRVFRASAIFEGKMEGAVQHPS